MQYTFEITVDANSPSEANALITSAATLMKKLKPNELKKLADVVVNDPIKTGFAKKALGL
jgi:hypothetical protein